MKGTSRLRPGAGGVVGSDYVAKSPPDGYTLLLGTVSTHAAAVSLYEKLPYDPMRDFAPITEIATIPNLVVVNAASVPAQTLGELVQLAKKQPGKLTFASNGAGTSNHLATELLKTTANIDNSFCTPSTVSHFNTSIFMVCFR